MKTLVCLCAMLFATGCFEDRQRVKKMEKRIQSLERQLKSKQWELSRMHTGVGWVERRIGELDQKLTQTNKLLRELQIAFKDMNKTAPQSLNPGPRPFESSLLRRFPPARPVLPGKGSLTRGDIKSGINRIKPSVRRCFDRYKVPGMIRVSITVKGANGRVSAADVRGRFKGTPSGNCVARAVRRAQFATFGQTAQRFTYPFILR